MEKPPQKSEVLHEKLKIVLIMGILKKKFSTPNFTELLNPQDLWRHKNFTDCVKIYSR